MFAYVDKTKKSYKNWFYFTMDSGDNLSCSMSYAIIRLFAIDVCVCGDYSQAATVIFVHV